MDNQLALRGSSTPQLISSWLWSHPCQNHMASSLLTLGMLPGKYFLFKRLKNKQNSKVCDIFMPAPHLQLVPKRQTTQKEASLLSESTAGAFNWEHKDTPLLFSLNSLNIPPSCGKGRKPLIVLPSEAWFWKIRISN